VALVRTDVSEEPGTSFIKVTKIGALGTTQAATSNRHTLPHSVTTQKTPFFIVTAVKTSNLTDPESFRNVVLSISLIIPDDGVQNSAILSALR
jgi:hypothetical protein